MKNVIYLIFYMQFLTLNIGIAQNPPVGQIFNGNIDVTLNFNNVENSIKNYLMIYDLLGVIPPVSYRKKINYSNGPHSDSATPPLHYAHLNELK